MSLSDQNTSAQSVIVDTSRSPYTRLRPAPIKAVILEDTFWRHRRQLNRDVMLPAQYGLCERTGRIANFRRAAGQLEGDFQGQYFNDSDVYKLLEAAAWALVGEDSVELKALVDRLIDVIAAAQEPDGYLNTFFTFERASQRWTNFDLHEMYCAGHLIQAAVAHYRSTGETRLLHVATRFADHICARFGPEEQGKQFGNDGHPEIEMALVELYRTTGERKYLAQARYLVANRGYGRVSDRPFGHFPTSYHQDHLPFHSLTRLEGHAVRAVYLNCGATDIAAERDEPELRTALDTMWDSMSSRQMYIHGGLGPRHENEGFGPNDYELPNERAHAETCASVANAMWNWRLLLLTGQARYADMMELELYNSILSGVSLDGKGYFYQNPLSDDGHHRRQEWFSTACCPGNVSRLLSELPGYFYSTTDTGVWIHLYASNSAALTLPDNSTIELTQRTNYPWSGEIRVETKTAGLYDLYLRLPGWCKAGWTVTVNQEVVGHELTDGNYLHIRREWRAHDVVQLNLPMPVERMESHPFVAENHTRVALMRGPVLYCVEAVDHPDTDVRLFELSESDTFEPEYAPDMLNGVVVLRGTAQVRATEADWGKQLYRPQESAAHANSARTAVVTAIPYYAWANREPGPMLVWLPTV